jgi:hypothetical protein
MTDSANEFELVGQQNVLGRQRADRRIGHKRITPDDKKRAEAETPPEPLIDTAEFWCARLGSNQQPLPSEGSTLSIELRAHFTKSAAKSTEAAPKRDREHTRFRVTRPPRRPRKPVRRPSTHHGNIPARRERFA